MRNTNSFLPDDYVAPTGNSSYAKLQTGANKFRILSKPVVGWCDWIEKKPKRFAVDNKPAPHDPKKAVKFFWAFVIWNYNDKKIQILEITQKGIQSAIEELSKHESWGSPFKYDLNINKSGSGMETEYSTTPLPPTELSNEAKEAYKATPINLQALFTGGDPFATTSTTSAKTAPKVETPVATPATDSLINSDANGDLPF